MPDISPSYFNVDANGVIEANFPGAVTLPAAIIGEDSGNMVRWVRQADGAVLAQLFCLNDPPPGPFSESITTLKTLLPPDPGNIGARTRITAEGNFADTPPQVRLASVEVQYDDAADVGEVNARVATSNLDVKEYKILDTQGNSRWMQLDNEEEVIFMAGIVGTTGIASANPIGNWTSQQLNVGVYQVNFNTAFLHNPYVTINAVGIADVNCAIGVETTSSFQYRTFTQAGGAVNSAVHFMAVGKRP